MIAALFLLAQPVIAPPAPPAPPPVITRSMPPLVRTVGREVRPPVTFQVRVLGGGQQLYADQLRVGGSGASYNQTNRESPEQVCTSYESGLERSLMVTVSPSYGEDGNRYRVSASWRRPLGNGCDRGQRTAGVEQQVTVAPGQSVRIEGDAGLVVELTRR